VIDPPKWTKNDLAADLDRAVERFRRERLEEPLEAYLEIFDEYQGVFEELLETTTDLTRLLPTALTVLTNDRLMEAFRYLPGPPISLDDLKTVAETTSFAKSRVQNDADLAKRSVELVLMALDRRRFPWVSEKREPTEAEKTAAVVASAALIATQRTGTSRRRASKQNQERSLEDALLRSEFRKVPTRQVVTFDDAPGEGQFCGESLLGERKADFIIRLWDRRILAVECKVSNSATNSVKRLNNDAAAKAEVWRRDFGERQVVPAALLSGVYKIHNLLAAQERGLAIFWAHDLDELIKWIEKTR
jgi:hypothetical protein